MKHTYIIAEAGINHNGNLDIAKKMIDVAADAGADAVKFQTYKTGALLCKDAPKAKYQEMVNKSESQFEMLERRRLTIEMHEELFRYCSDKQIVFLSSPFDLESIDVLKKMGVNTVKIPSGEITNYPYLVKISKAFENIIISTGMSTIAEIRQAVNLLQKEETKKITLLQCNTQYPTPIEDANLYAMLTLKEEFKIPIGYSDHTVGIEVPVAAAAMGATVIEKHFTLDRNMEGPDQNASIEPEELRQMITYIRNVDKALGNGDKRVSLSERENIAIARKSIVAACPIKKGEKFTDINLTTKRPGIGISPMRWNEIIGTYATMDYEADEIIKL